MKVTSDCLLYEYRLRSDRGREYTKLKQNPETGNSWFVRELHPEDKAKLEEWIQKPGNWEKLKHVEQIRYAHLRPPTWVDKMAEFLRSLIQ